MSVVDRIDSNPRAAGLLLRAQIVAPCAAMVLFWCLVSSEAHLWHRAGDAVDVVLDLMKVLLTSWLLFYVVLGIGAFVYAVSHALKSAGVALRAGLSIQCLVSPFYS